MTAAVTGIPAVAAVAPAPRPGSATAHQGGFADLMKQAMATITPAQTSKDHPQGKQDQKKDSPAHEGAPQSTTTATVGGDPALITAAPAASMSPAQLATTLAGSSGAPVTTTDGPTVPQTVPDQARASVAMSVSVAMEVAAASSTALTALTAASPAPAVATLPTGAPQAAVKAAQAAFAVPPAASKASTQPAPTALAAATAASTGTETSPVASTGTETAPAAAIATVASAATPTPTATATMAAAAPKAGQVPSSAPKAAKSPLVTTGAVASVPGQPAPTTPGAPAATPAGVSSLPIKAVDASAVVSVAKSGGAPNPVPSADAQTQVPATAAEAKIDLAATATPATPAAAFMASAPAAPFTVQATSPTTAAAPAAPTPGTFADQVAKPVFTLATTAVPGEHVMVIKVTPDNLGPVTVQAHITGSSVRIELFAPNDAGREALRQVMPDLKRDIAASGLQTQLNLSSGNQPGAQQGDTGRNAFNQRAFAPNPGTTNSRQLLMDTPSSVTHPGLSGTDAVLDVMA